MDTLPPGAAYNLLKPTYNEVIKDPTKHNVLKLKEMLQNVSPMAQQVLQDLTLFPLELHLKNTQLGSEVRRCLVDCIKEILQSTRIRNLKKFLELYTLLFYQIYDQDKDNMVGDVPEELKVSVVECITCLLKQASSDVINELYDKKHSPKLGQGFYICIHMAQQEKLRSLRLASIELLMTLAQVHSAADKDDVVFRHQVGDIIMFFLPGIVSGLQKIITEDEKQGHKITMLALKAWGEIIAIVMEDIGAADTSQPLNLEYSLNSPETRPEQDPLANKWQDNTRESMLKNIQEKNRTPEWYRAASEKLAFSARAIGVVQRHSHSKVRMELASTCQFLLSRCCRNLKPCVMYFIEILIMLSEDEIERIAKVSRSCLRSFSKTYEEDSGKSLLEILEENFYNLITKLPRILHGTDDFQQLAALKLLAGYIKLLGVNNLPRVLSLSAHLNRLMLTLIQALELENSTVSLLEDYCIRDVESHHVAGHSKRWKNFVHFTDNNVLRKMEDVCFLLGQFGDLHILIFHLLDLFHTAPQHRKEITLLINEIVHGSAHRLDVQLESIAENILQVYLEPSVWYMSLNVEEQANDFQETMSITLKEAQNNVILACLLVEGVGKIARALGSRFDIFLLKTLYVVLERAGSTNGLVSEAGMTSVQDIACACGHGENITDLVQANVDYFSYHVTCKLRKVEQHPGVLDVLNIVMKYSTMDVLPCLKEIVQDVMLQNFDICKDKRTIAFLCIFHTFLLSVKHWLKSREECETKAEVFCESDSSTNTLIESIVVNNIIEYYRCKKQSEDFSSDFQLNDKNSVRNSDGDNDKDYVSANYNEDDDELNKKKKLPLYVEMTVSILKKCIHYLPTKKREQKLLVLAILQDGLLILEPWENELLPIVHAIWSPFVNRLTDTSDPLVMNHSFGLLCVLAETAKDFIHSRTLKQVFTPLCQMLTKSATESKKKDKGSSYRFTQLFKLQNEVLSKVGDLAVNLQLQEREIDQLLTAAAPYLSILQPLPLQNSCVKLYLKISTVYEATVWLKVIGIWCPVKILNPANNDLHVIKVMDSPIHNQEEFKKNIEEILSVLNTRILTN